MISVSAARWVLRDKPTLRGGEAWRRYWLWVRLKVGSQYRT
jgi:hypothetical protein